MALDPISGIAELANSIISRVWPDKTEVQKQQFALELQRLLSESALLTKQMDVNTAEASNPNRTWITWRELVGYICATAFAWFYVGQPIITYFVVVTGHPAPILPTFDMASLMYLLTGMLGIAGIKTYEKTKLDSNNKK